MAKRRPSRPQHESEPPALDSLTPALAGTDANAVFQRQHKDFAVADLPRGSRAATFDDRVDSRFDKAFIHRDHELHFSQQVHCELIAFVEHLGLPLLPAETLAIHDRQPNNLDLRERLLNVLKLARLNDGND